MKVLNLIFILIELAVAFAGTVYRVNVNTSLNVRSAANEKASVVASLKRDQYIYVTSTTNGFAKFYKGYCSLK